MTIPGLSEAAIRQQVTAESFGWCSVAAPRRVGAGDYLRPASPDFLRASRRPGDNRPHPGVAAFGGGDAFPGGLVAEPMSQNCILCS